MNVVKIYFDMDGVLADFNRGVKELGGTDPLDQMQETPETTKRLWDAVRKVEHFYDRLEFLPGAEEMFRMLYAKYGDKCEILSGIPKPDKRIEGAGEDKTKWVHRLLSPSIHVNIVYKEEKKNYCQGPECILIDDLVTNIEAWRAYGGTGILHTSAEDTVCKLKNMGVL